MKAEAEAKAAKAVEEFHRTQEEELRKAGEARGAAAEAKAAAEQAEAAAARETEEEQVKEAAREARKAMLAADEAAAAEAKKKAQEAKEKESKSVAPTQTENVRAAEAGHSHHLTTDEYVEVRRQRAQQEWDEQQAAKKAEAQAQVTGDQHEEGKDGCVVS